MGDSPRRLLYIVNETYFFMSHRASLAAAAQQAGYEIHVAGPSDHVWAPDDFTIDSLGHAGFIFHDIPLSRRGTKPLQELATARAIFRTCRRVRPDLVHLLTIKPVLYGGIAARLVGVPALVSGVTGLGQVFVASGPRAALLRRAVAFGYRMTCGHPSSRIIVQNAGDRDIIANIARIPPEQIALIRGSGVSLEAYPATIPTDDVEALVILPARLIWEKGVGEFVAAARTLREQGVAARFALVGDTRASNPRAVPETTLREWAAEGVVEWWGRRQDMAAVFAESHIVCLPSTYGEGVPRALIEAAACARPIVASDIPGCREVVRTSENGLLVPAGDAEALARALGRLIANPELRARMGERGREIAEASFSIEDIARQTLEVYDALLD